MQMWAVSRGSAGATSGPRGSERRGVGVTSAGEAWQLGALTFDVLSNSHRRPR